MGKAKGKNLGEAGAGDEIRTRDPLLGKQQATLSLLNKMPVSTLAELSGFSKSYISQVRHGKCPPSKRLIDILSSQAGTKRRVDYLSPFLQSRQSRNASPNTIELYGFVLERFLSTDVDPGKAKGRDVERYLLSIPANGISLGNPPTSESSEPSSVGWKPNTPSRLRCPTSKAQDYPSSCRPV